MHDDGQEQDWQDFIRAWAFALRDLCDQGALSVSATFEGTHGPLTFTYSAGRGTRVVVSDGPTLQIPDSALDTIDYTLADSAPSSSLHSPQTDPEGEQ